VETISDLYVAITGCPEHQEHHAVIMAHIATDCHWEISDVTSRLWVMIGGAYYVC
jgi:hypothetical protein